MTNYQNTAKNIIEQLNKDVKEIFESINNKLVLEFGKENLLELDDNCIEFSTTIGYCLEEFISKKLLSIKPDFYKRDNRSTKKSSYDLYVKQNNIKILINLKANKKNNNAIAMLGQLYKDYISTNNDSEKLFLVFKTNYRIDDAAIIIKGVDTFFLEQCDFNVMTTDNRNWSKDNNNLSGRIQYNTITNKLIDISEISYLDTKDNINKFIQTKRNKNKKPRGIVRLS